MAVPDPYDNHSLMTFMHADLGDVAAELGWTVAANSYAPAVDETLLAYGELDLAAITGTSNLIALRALARREAWRLAANSFAVAYNYSTATESYSRGQIPEHVAKRLAAAEAAAVQYDTSGSGDAQLRPLPGPRTPYDADPAGLLVFGSLA